MTNTNNQNNTDLEFDTNLEQNTSENSDLEDTLSHEGFIDSNNKDSIQDILWENEKLKSDLDKITRFSAAIKTEFDAVVRKFDIERKENKYLELTKIVAKFQKLLEGIRMFFLHIDNDLANNEQIKWLKLIYEWFINQELSNMWVHQIVSLWLSPDTELHEVLMVQDATDEDLQFLQEYGISLDWDKKDYNLSDLHGKIIKELEVWYYYLDGEKKYIIKPSKVIVAN